MALAYRPTLNKQHARNCTFSLKYHKRTAFGAATALFLWLWCRLRSTSDRILTIYADWNKSHGVTR